ncbi:GGDEF domain-containing protein [Rhodanobacter sp. L36]|uniref:tetratricopeptide repeat-containing diguanylate cyclase n=1 Tax=Rhodanobacter sp. L36 TaxID=1747221 RepID=UPI0020B13A4C|nr:GGDEF domain-containing protein [Rhodanobacter sp. L36]
MKPWSALAALAFCAVVQATATNAATSNASDLLDRTESLRTKDHPQFVRMLQQVHRDAIHLPSGQQWQLRYLDAWETAFQGDYGKAEGQLQSVIDHSGDPTLVAKASALLMSAKGINNRYEEAFQLANQLATNLPKIQDKLARFLVLYNLSQLLGSAGQNDLAIRYAQMMEDALPPGETLCMPLTQEVAALYYSKRLTSSSPELQRAVDSCQNSGQPVYANFVWLIRSSVYLDEGHPDKALTLLNRIAPSIRDNDYQAQILSWQAAMAQTYAKLGDDANARAMALDVVSAGGSGDDNEPLRNAYEVLYQVEKKDGDAAAALAYYERYVAQDKGYLNAVSARAMAYQMAQQQVLTKKLETEALSKQNNILRLQQALDKKAVEASRLYIVLLLMAIASIAFWLFRLKRSQLRFKRLSRCDGLTGIYNHQHFISEADRVLRLLEKKRIHACLISIDLDHFKEVNDNHGHAMGDAVLKRTVAICQQQLRAADVFGRLGGEEFGVLLHGCSRDQGMEIANRIRVAIEATPMMENGCIVSISASVGLASSDTCGHGLQRLHMEADAALYRAKRAGRNRVIADIEKDDLVAA